MSKKVKDYIENVLAQKRPEFGGKAVCPFAKPELEMQKLMIGHSVFLMSLTYRSKQKQKIWHLNNYMTNIVI